MYIISRGYLSLINNLMLLFVQISINLPSSTSILGDNCVTPPLNCPNKNVTFWLYTRSLKNKPHELKVAEQTSIDRAPWVPNAPIKILIHGYTGHKDYPPNTDIRPAYFECCDYNIISIDYQPIAPEPCYMQAAINTELVGKCTAQLIDEMVFNHGILLSRIHVIGFSLGAHVSGFIANYIKSGKLERISGLDPALPLFAVVDTTRKLDRNDAKLVDVLHTNALQEGKLEISGHVDFFANGGMMQPGCKATANQSKTGCAHARAPKYYAESITTQVGFYGKKCFSWLAYIIGWCEVGSSSEVILFGEYMPKNASGMFFFDTNSQPPYSRGLNSNNESSYK